MQPLTRKSMNCVIMNMLRCRQVLNRKLTMRRRVPLSHYAKVALKNGNVGQFFWYRFDASHPEISRKKVGNTSVARAVACTKGMAIDHLDALADEMIRLHIMKNAEKVAPGEWTGDIDVNRVYNCDETPQAINYGSDGHINNLAYCPKGEECTKVTRENREYVTITPFIGLSGSIPICQVIFSSSNITSWMAPEIAVKNIPNLLISNTANGYQDGNSFLHAIKKFEDYLDEKCITKPVILLTDGHSSRFDVDVLRSMVNDTISAFVSPPDTTSVTQPLDQINATLHTSYRKEISDLFLESYVNKEVFMNILGKMWPTWASKDSVVGAFHRVGISKEGLSVEFMQQKKFKAAEMILDSVQSSSG